MSGLTLIVKQIDHVRFDIDSKSERSFSHDIDSKADRSCPV